MKTEAQCLRLIREYFNIKQEDQEGFDSLLSELYDEGFYDGGWEGDKMFLETLQQIVYIWEKADTTS